MWNMCTKHQFYHKLNEEKIFIDIFLKLNQFDHYNIYI